MKTYLSFFLFTLLSACSTFDEHQLSKGWCQSIPCEACTQSDQLTKNHCEMLGGSFKPQQ